MSLQDRDYATAARLAFSLRHPGRLLSVLRAQPGGPTAALAALQALVGGLTADDLATALSYCRYGEGGRSELFVCVSDRVEGSQAKCVSV